MIILIFFNDYSNDYFFNDYSNDYSKDYSNDYSKKNIYIRSGVCPPPNNSKF